MDLLILCSLVYAVGAVASYQSLGLIGYEKNEDGFWIGVWIWPLFFAFLVVYACYVVFLFAKGCISAKETGKCADQNKSES